MMEGEPDTEWTIACLAPCIFLLGVGIGCLADTGMAWWKVTFVIAGSGFLIAAFTQLVRAHIFHAKIRRIIRGNCRNGNC